SAPRARGDDPSVAVPTPPRPAYSDLMRGWSGVLLWARIGQNITAHNSTYVRLRASRAAIQMWSRKLAGVNWPRTQQSPRREDPGRGSVVAVRGGFSRTRGSTRRCARSRLPCARHSSVVTAGAGHTSGTCPSATERRPRWPGPPSRPSPGAGAVLTSPPLLLPLSLYRWESGMLGQSFLDGLRQQAGQPLVLGDLQAVAQGLQRCGHLRPLLGAQPAGEAGCRVSGVCPALAPDDFGAPRSPPSPLGMDG